MNTPTPTPRTDAATYPADCLGTTLVTHRDCARTLETELVTLTGTYTCTHHNDAERTACPVCLVTAITAERDQLRSDCENETKWAAHYLADVIASKARAERAEAAETVALAKWNGALERAMKAEADLVALEQCHDDNCRAVVKIDAERDQLRAENSTLRAAQKACEACDEPTAFEVRQLRAEAERTDAIYQRACEVEQELRAELAEMHKSFAGNVHTENRVLQTELATEREKSERYRLATLKLEAELAAERARLDWVFRNCKVTADDFTTGNRDVYAIHDREDLGAAMKEGTK